MLMYHIPDKGKGRNAACFNATVLELVKLIQAGLAMFDLFDISPEERNGLLCDVTCEGIRRWVTEVGEPCMRIEVRIRLTCEAYSGLKFFVSQRRELQTRQSSLLCSV